MSARPPVSTGQGGTAAIPKLTPDQEAIARARSGTVLVLAAVGAGKTTVLTERISRALRDGQDPARVLAVTFTNRAATHLRDSLEKSATSPSAKVQARTFHSLCAWILRSEARFAGLLPDFWIYDEEDCLELLRLLGVESQGLYDLHRDASSVPLGQASVDLYYQGGFSTLPWASDYIRELTNRGAVDFAGLVFLARALLSSDPAVAEKWSRRFDMVSVDEIQDTHISEYEVLRCLAKGSRSLCMVGDLDQTIYGWRGSQPDELLEQLEQDFGPVQRLSLDENFRATRELLAVSDRIASRMSSRATHVRPHSSLPTGQPPVILRVPTETQENTSVASACADLVRMGAEPHRIAVLTRTNRQADAIAAALKPLDVPHTTAEQMRFFRRREIKDVVSVLHLVMDPSAEGAARRIALRLIPGVGRETVKTLLTEGGRAGLRLVDLFDSMTIKNGDPYWGYDEGEVVVIDTETTGLSHTEDEVVEIAGIRLRGNTIADRFHRFVRPSRSVGNSQNVHGWSDAYLAQHGEEPAVVYRDFAEFIGGCPVAGHNVGFDVRMLEAGAPRAGVDLKLKIAFDTLISSRRLLSTHSHRLDQLAQTLGLASRPSHQAMDDVEATIELARALAPRIREAVSTRNALIQKYGPKFEEFRKCVDFWRWCGLRPGSLVRDVLKRTRVLEANADSRQRQRNIESLRSRIARMDDQESEPLESLRRILDKIALSKESDHLDEEPGVRLITVHQAKGLEFDHVFIPGLVEDGFPSYFAKRDGNIEEERRLFYVAVTRARVGLVMTCHGENERGWQRQPSRFMADATE